MSFCNVSHEVDTGRDLDYNRRLSIESDDILQSYLLMYMLFTFSLPFAILPDARSGFQPTYRMKAATSSAVEEAPRQRHFANAECHIGLMQMRRILLLQRGLPARRRLREVLIFYGDSHTQQARP